MTDYEQKPDSEYFYTVIAPSARSEGVFYTGQRRWYKTLREAEEFIQSIYAKQPSKVFNLVIVKAVKEYSPVPTVPVRVTQEWRD